MRWAWRLLAVSPGRHGRTGDPARGLATFKSDHETQWALWMAASVIFTLPVVVLVFLGQRFFMEGIATTGLKG